MKIIEFLLVILVAGIGWIVKTLWNAVKSLKTDVFKLNEKISITREDLPKSYVQKEDYKDDIHDIKEMLTRLFEKIDSKVDK